MNFYNNLEMDPPGVGLGAELLETKDVMNCPKDEAYPNSILRLTTLSSKNV